MTATEFDHHFRVHWKPTLNCALAFGCSHAEAEDVAQDVMTEIWANGQRCSLQTMVWQHVIKLRRRKNRPLVWIGDAGTADMTCGEIDLIESLETRCDL